MIYNSDSDLPPAKQRSLTAKNFSIKEQCMESLLEIVENYEVTKELKGGLQRKITYAYYCLNMFI